MREVGSVWTLALVLVVAGCAPIQPLPTPSGRPEITIPGVARKQVVDVLVADLLSHGLQVRKVDEYSAVFAKRDDSFGAAVVYGSRYNATPEARITFNFVEVGGAVRVFCSAAMVTNPGSGHERINDVTVAQGQVIQDMLQRLRSKFP